jgi:hypothetical protein
MAPAHEGLPDPSLIDPIALRQEFKLRIRPIEERNAEFVVVEAGWGAERRDRAGAALLAAVPQCRGRSLGVSDRPCGASGMTV